ncbi:MAG: type II toxin-antitoxin system VapC family toxin [Candidatus Diapherotrites archaeon]|nr:type II toxin-antitoxin system VapC family toxin [Candidatus Diapherotrites archaeon]
MILLDTDVLIELMQKGSKRGETIFKKLQSTNEEITTTTINLYEILHGLFKNGDFETATKISDLNILEFTKNDAILAAKMEFKLEKKGTKVARLDCMIAAIAINNSAKLFTLNLKHFKRFETFGLKLFRM